MICYNYYYLCQIKIDLMRIWKREVLQQIASGYQTKRDFRANNRNAYEFAYRHGFLISICTHMIQVGNKHNRCVYCYEFPNKSVYVGITYDFQRRKSDRESKPDDTVTRYINKTGLQPVHLQLTDYISVEIAQKLEGEYVQKYRDNGWHVLNIAKTGGIGGDILYWTYEKCIEESQKYKRRSDFNLHSKGAYDACRRNGWIKDVYKHMKEYLSKPSGYWTKERCITEAQKYSTLKEFRNNSSGAYGRVCREKWLTEIHQYLKPIKNKITIKRCVDDAQKYQTRSEWAKNSGSIYQFASKNKWLNECCGHMKRKNKFNKPFICTITVL